IEPPGFVSCKQRVSLDLAADRTLHELRRSHAPAHRDAAAADGNIGHRAEARTGPYADEPLRAARLARGRAPGEGGDRARFQRDAESTCEGQPRPREERHRESEEVPRDRLLRAAHHGGDLVAPGERVGSQQQGTFDGTELTPHADAGAESWRSKRTAVRHAAALSPGEEEPRFARRLEPDRGAGQLPVSGSHPGLRSASIRGGLQISFGDAGCRQPDGFHGRAFRAEGEIGGPERVAEPIPYERVDAGRTPGGLRGQLGAGGLTRAQIDADYGASRIARPYDEPECCVRG